MRPSSVVSLLLMFFILHVAQGIRLEKGGFMQVGHQNVNEEKFSLTRKRNDVINGGVILCKEGHCTGMNRKLATVTTTISTATSKNENGETKANHPTNSSASFGQQEVIHDHYVDIVDIAEMDYSPAKRKPPIHN